MRIAENSTMFVLGSFVVVWAAGCMAEVDGQNAKYVGVGVSALKSAGSGADTASADLALLETLVDPLNESVTFSDEFDGDILDASWSWENPSGN